MQVAEHDFSLHILKASYCEDILYTLVIDCMHTFNEEIGCKYLISVH